MARSSRFSRFQRMQMFAAQHAQVPLVFSVLVKCEQNDQYDTLDLQARTHAEARIKAREELRATYGRGWYVVAIERA